MDIKTRISNFIEEHKDSDKANYDASLVTTAYEIKGIKMAELVDFARELAGEKIKFNKLPLRCHEEIMLAGLIITEMNVKPSEKIKYFKTLLQYIDNYSIVDIVVPRLVGVESERDFFVSLLSSNKPFYIRAGIVWFKKFELKQNVRGVVNLLNDTVKNTNYFVEMALAWIYLEALLIDYDYMIEFVQKLKRFIIRNRTLQKACESSRVSDKRKKEIRALRSKLLGIQI